MDCFTKSATNSYLHLHCNYSSTNCAIKLSFQRRLRITKESTCRWYYFLWNCYNKLILWLYIYRRSKLYCMSSCWSNNSFIRRSLKIWNWKSLCHSYCQILGNWIYEKRVWIKRLEFEWGTSLGRSWSNQTWNLKWKLLLCINTSGWYSILNRN